MIDWLIDWRGCGSSVEADVLSRISFCCVRFPFVTCLTQVFTLLTHRPVSGILAYHSRAAFRLYCSASAMMALMVQVTCYVPVGRHSDFTRGQSQHENFQEVYVNNPRYVHHHHHYHQQHQQQQQLVEYCCWRVYSQSQASSMQRPAGEGMRRARRLVPLEASSRRLYKELHEQARAPGHRSIHPSAVWRRTLLLQLTGPIYTNARSRRRPSVRLCFTRMHNQSSLDAMSPEPTYRCLGHDDVTADCFRWRRRRRRRAVEYTSAVVRFIRRRSSSATVVGRGCRHSRCLRWRRRIWISGGGGSAAAAWSSSSVVVAMPSSENRSDVGNSVDRLSSTSGRGERRKVKVSDPVLTQLGGVYSRDGRSAFSSRRSVTSV